MDLDDLPRHDDPEWSSKLRRTQDDMSPGRVCGRLLPLILKWPDNPLGPESSFAPCVLPEGHVGHHAEVTR